MDWLFSDWGLVVCVLIARAIQKASREKKRLQQHGIRTQGIVIRNKFSWGRISVFRPIIRFTTTTGQGIEAVEYSGLELAVPRFSKGEEVALIYEENNPLNFRQE
jgi:hypothetical protein